LVLIFAGGELHLSRQGAEKCDKRQQVVVEDAAHLQFYWSHLRLVMSSFTRLRTL